jgi:hypothetical protein
MEGTVVGKSARTTSARREAMVRKVAAGALAAALTELVLNGCAGDTGAGAPDGEVTSAPGLSASSAAAPAEDGAGAGNNNPDAGYVPLGSTLEDALDAGVTASVVGVRVGVEGSRTRVVVDLEGGRGGWHASGVDAPLQEGSGEVLEVEGERFVNLAVTGVVNGSADGLDQAGRKYFTEVVPELPHGNW